MEIYELIPHLKVGYEQPRSFDPTNTQNTIKRTLSVKKEKDNNLNESESEEYEI